jgi:uncharacterized membrane protein SpoIIM required for sporulation
MQGPVSIDWFNTFSHNSGVLFTVFVLSFLYRGYAAVLILSWNACVWGLSLAFVTLHYSQDAIGLGVVWVAAKTILALLPHLALEALAYICVSLSAIKMSKSILWGQTETNNLWNHLIHCVQGVFASFVLLVIAAMMESFIPHQFL